MYTFCPHGTLYTNALQTVIYLSAMHLPGLQNFIGYVPHDQDTVSRPFIVMYVDKLHKMIQSITTLKVNEQEAKMVQQCTLSGGSCHGDINYSIIQGSRKHVTSAWDIGHGHFAGEAKVSL